MLSTSSFNALLKTLEEPPPHVKFLLATTDPQKLPMTVLSRCLQFNLKNLTAERIQQHLAYVLGEESIEKDEAALWLLARAADGSMRDALSLTDQAIAFGAGSVFEADVRAMLGTIDQHLVYRIVSHLAAHEVDQVLAAVQSLSEFSPDYHSVLGDMLSLLHRVALAQVYPAAVDNSLGDRDQVMALAQSMRPEEVQLYYQVALMGRKDLPLVPEPREGLEMTLLRMLAFRPASMAPPNAQADSALAPVGVVSERSEPEAARLQPAWQAEPERPVARSEERITAPPPQLDEPPPWEDLPPDLDVAPVKKPDPAGVYNVQPESGQHAVASLGTSNTEPPSTRVPARSKRPDLQIATADELRGDRWAAILPELGLSGMVDSIARNLSLELDSPEHLCFHYTREQEAMLSPERRERISTAILAYLDESPGIEFKLGEQTRETPARLAERRRIARQAEAVRSIENDDKVRELMQQFGASIDYESIQPID